MPTRLIALLAGIVAACGTVDYDGAPVGRFDGNIFVMWVGEGDGSGDGRFLYVPDPNDPLTFTRGAGGPHGVIRPEMMYTDGGSTPRVVQIFEGFSPWGYAPAYMIHDWLFVARACNLDGAPTPGEARLAAMEFQESAEIMAEAIKTLLAERRVSPNDFAPGAISSAVAGPISRGIWDERGRCASPRVDPADRERALAALARAAPEAGMRSATPPDPAPAAGGARVVAAIAF